MKRGVVCAALLALAFGCSSSTSDPNLDAWEREVKILAPAQVGDRQYQELGGLLEEREPMRSGFGGEEEAVDAARQKLRRRAAELVAEPEEIGDDCVNAMWNGLRRYADLLRKLIDRAVETTANKLAQSQPVGSN